MAESDQALGSNTENMTFFVSYDAFGYITDTYGFEHVPVAGLNSQDEHSQKDLTAIVDLAKEKNIEQLRLSKTCLPSCLKWFRMKSELWSFIT
ncbi:MAG: metal ABC transporter substrate-binding protein [Planococcus sp. (in: firmicutes)]|nr:metal ABC transporter substrate-binding protein [Planococcus sp. (in: firmicutes)]